MPICSSIELLSEEFQQETQTGEILFQEEQWVSTMSLFQRSGKGKSQEMMVSQVEMEVAEDKAQQLEGMPDLDAWLNRCKICWSSKAFMTRWTSYVDQHFAITKVIIELMDSSRRSGLARKATWGNWFYDHAMVFYEKDGKIVSSHHKSHSMW